MKDGAGHSKPEHPTLRDRKKSKQRQSIVSTAMELFSEYGYEGVKIDEIALGAEVSKKTVYNYFSSKRDILIEFIATHFEDVTIEAFQSVLDSLSGDLIEDLSRMFQADIDDVVTPGNKRLWLEIMAVMVRDAGDERFRNVLDMFSGHISRLLQTYQSHGQLSPDMDTKTLAHVIHLIFTDALTAYCASPERTADDVVASVKATLRELIRES